MAVDGTGADVISALALLVPFNVQRLAKGWLQNKYAFLPPGDLILQADFELHQLFSVKGRGLPGTPAGDLIVPVRIETPPTDSEASRKTYQRFAEAILFNPRKKLESVT